MSNKNEVATVKATLDLAHNLELEVVAEGVEDKEIMEKLHSLSWDIYSGFYFSKPAPSKEMQE